MNIFDLFFPPKCPFCGEVLPLSKSACFKCIKNYPIGCVQETFKLDSDIFLNISPYLYETEIKKAIWKYKFRNHKEYAQAFATAMNESIKQSCKSNQKIDIITNVPISKKRLLERGYDQTELFTKEIAKKFRVTHKKLLVKQKNNLEQHTLPYEERCKNVKGVYSILKPYIIKGKTILLCDDIITTGNTMNECRKLLMDSGANEVFCATIATVKNKSGS